MNEYPGNWDEIAQQVKEEAGRRCVRCGHPSESPKVRIPCDGKCDLSRHIEVMGIWALCKQIQREYDDGFSKATMDVNDYRDENGLWTNQRQRVLTVHHLDGDKNNSKPYNLLSLDQVCHLQIQAIVILERPWIFEHSEWFKPYAAAWYAYKYLDEIISLDKARERMDDLLALERLV